MSSAASAVRSRELGQSVRRLLGLNVADDPGENRIAMACSNDGVFHRLSGWFNHTKYSD